MSSPTMLIRPSLSTSWSTTVSTECSSTGAGMTLSLIGNAFFELLDFVLKEAEKIVEISNVSIVDV